MLDLYKLIQRVHQIPREDLKRLEAWLGTLPNVRKFGINLCLEPKKFGHAASNRSHTSFNLSQKGRAVVETLAVHF